MGDRGRAVAHLIISRPEEVALLTATKIAELLETSESTVVRFAQAIGYSGYPELRRDLQEHVRQFLNQAGRVAVTPRGGSVAKRSIQQDVENLRVTTEQLDEATIKTAVGMIARARRVYVIGIRSVFGLADMFAYHLRPLVDQPILLDPARGMRLDQLLGVAPEDVVIAISFPRYSRMVLGAVEIVRQEGGEAIAITDSSLSPLAAQARAVLTVGTKSAFFGNSLVAALAVLNALLSELLAVRRKRALKSFSDYDRFTQAIRHIPIDGDEDALVEAWSGSDGRARK